jgi:hypothetical protein
MWCCWCTPLHREAQACGAASALLSTEKLKHSCLCSSPLHHQQPTPPPPSIGMWWHTRTFKVPWPMLPTSTLASQKISLLASRVGMEPGLTGRGLDHFQQARHLLNQMRERAIPISTQLIPGERTSVSLTYESH